LSREYLRIIPCPGSVLRLAVSVHVVSLGQVTQHSSFCQPHVGRCLLTLSPEDGNTSTSREIAFFARLRNNGGDRKTHYSLGLLDP
jgi:hypothetical protein